MILFFRNIQNKITCLYHVTVEQTIRVIEKRTTLQNSPRSCNYKILSKYSFRVERIAVPTVKGLSRTIVWKLLTGGTSWLKQHWSTCNSSGQPPRGVRHGANFRRRKRQSPLDARLFNKNRSNIAKRLRKCVRCRGNGKVIYSGWWLNLPMVPCLFGNVYHPELVR